VETVTGFLDELARRLVPACDPAVVRAVFETASSGYQGSRARDGRRASVLTPSGVPFEASVTGGSGRTVAMLRYVTEVASAEPFFRPRLTAQRAALSRLVGWLPDAEVAKRAEAELSCFVDTLFPDPGAVPARIRFATWFGIVHQPEVPSHLASLKLYGILFDGRKGLDRLATRWPGFSDLSDLVADLASLRPYMADLEIDAAGGQRYKLYLLSTVDGTPVDALARRVGADTAVMHAELARVGAAVRRWSRVFICCEAADGSDPGLSVHVPAKALVLDPPGMATLARQLVESRHGDTAAVDALEGAAASGAGGRWDYTVAGIGLARGGGLGKLNVYYAPGRGLDGAPHR
jgi:hypothetical protein